MIFWRPDMAMPMIKQLFAILPVHKISIQVCSITLSVWIGKFHKILHPSFSSTESGTCSYQLSSHSRWGFLGSSQWIFFATLSCLFPTLSWWYWFFPKLGQGLMMCVTPSTFLLENLKSGFSLVLSILYSTKLVRMI